MTPIQDAAQRLLAARREHRRVRLPDELRPADDAAAYAIQAAVERGLGCTPSAWKVGAAGPGATPGAAPIYDLRSSPARIDAEGMHMIGVEAEIAAEFARALPAREHSYGAAEVLGAVGRLRVVMEVCDSRLDDWASASDATKLADHGLNHALVVGDATTEVASIDCTRLAVRTLVNGNTIKEGVGSHALGDPMVLLPWLANHVRLRGGIGAGTVVTMGAWLGLHIVQPGDQVTIEFPAIGRARADFRR